MQFRLGTKISLLITLLVLFSVGLVGYFLVEREREFSLNTRIQESIKEVRLKGASLKDALHEVVSDVRFLSKVPPIQGIIRTRASKDHLDPLDGSTEEIWHQRLDQIFAVLLTEKKHYLQARYIGVADNGLEIVRVDRVGDEVVVRTDEEMQSKGERNYFKETIQLSLNEVYLSPINLNRERGKVEIPHKPTMRVAVPILDHRGEVFGIVIINLEFNEIVNRVLENDPTLRISNEQGDYLGHPDPAMTFGFDKGKRHLIQDDFPGLASFFESGNTEQEIMGRAFRNGREYFVYSIKQGMDLPGIRRFLALTRVQDISILASSGHGLIQNFTFLIIALILVSVSIGFYFSKRLTAPLQKINAAAGLFADRGIVNEVDVPPGDEIGELAGSIQAMMTTVQKRNEQIASTMNQVNKLYGFQNAVLNEAGISIIATDTEGIITLFNPTAERWLGYKNQEMVGHKTPAVFHKVEEVIERAAELSRECGKKIVPGFEVFILNARAGRAETREWTYVRKDGSEFPVLLSVTALKNDDGELFGYLGVATDLTERKRIELEIRKARMDAESANQAKSTFLANMSHEIRTPMNAILGYAQILRRDKTLSQEQLQAIQTIDSSGRHLLVLINDILDISKIESGQMDLREENFDLGSLLNEVRSMFQEKCMNKGIGLNFPEFDEDQALVTGDAGKLRQVLINLVGNAVKFTDKGSVTFQMHTEANHKYRFEVLDSGPGIAADKQRFIFQPFSQINQDYRKGGTGLGLAISQKQISLMGGELRVWSELGRGARFFFTLELRPAIGWNAASRSKFSNVSRLAEGYSANVLVVDDIKENRNVLVTLLSQLGIQVDQAEDGIQALEKISAKAPDLVFMDVHMPKMDGLEATQRIKENFKTQNIKVVCLTASAFEQQRQHFIESGFDAFIAKPFRSEEICEILERELKIEFDCGDPEDKKSDEVDLSNITLQEDLLLQMRKSTELYNVTQLEKSLEQLEAQGPEHANLARHLRGFLKNYDMESILKVLENISVGAA